VPGEGPATVARRFGDNLRRVRRREGLSQEQLAKRGSLHPHRRELFSHRHKGNVWRFKPHGETAFWRWVCSWARA